MVDFYRPARRRAKYAHPIRRMPNGKLQDKSLFTTVCDIGGCSLQLPGLRCTCWLLPLRPPIGTLHKLWQLPGYPELEPSIVALGCRCDRNHSCAGRCSFHLGIAC